MERSLPTREAGLTPESWAGGEQMAGTAPVCPGAYPLRRGKAAGPGGSEAPQTQNDGGPTPELLWLTPTPRRLGQAIGTRDLGGVGNANQSSLFSSSVHTWQYFASLHQVFLRDCS